VSGFRRRQRRYGKLLGGREPPSSAVTSGCPENGFRKPSEQNRIVGEIEVVVLRAPVPDHMITKFADTHHAGITQTLEDFGEYGRLARHPAKRDGRPVEGGNGEGT